MEYSLRDFLKPGDLGWILHQHGVRYAAEQSYDFSFEKEIAESIVVFIEQYKRGVSRIWVAESAAGIIGTIALHAQGTDEAEIRWIMVLPEYQGQGIGSRLLAEAIDFGRRRQVKLIHCCNVAVNSPGIPLYERFGFTFVSEAPVLKWGKLWVSRQYHLRLEIS